jgi:hypothetical protein
MAVVFTGTRLLALLLLVLLHQSAAAVHQP